MKHLVIFLLSITLALNLWSSTTAADRLNSYKQHMELAKTSIFKVLKWKNVGPYFMGGRIADIEGYDKNNNKFLLATASGGLWLTTNNATTWTSIFDDQASITIGDIAVSQSDENLIWVGTGEQNSSRSSYAGTGVYKSVDGGKSWLHMGLPESHHISRIIIDPQDNRVVFVAVLGHLYTTNPERGLYKTIDGGKTWKKVLFVSDNTGIIDVAMHPLQREILYAASWEKGRRAWNMVESGKESSIYKSNDHGESWNKAVSGFPQNQYTGRIGLAVTPASPDVVYAFLDNQEGKIRPVKKRKTSNQRSNITVASLMNMSVKDFLKLENKQLQLFLKENKAPERFTAERIKEFVRAGRLTPKGIAAMLSDANQRLFNTNIKGAEVYRSDNQGETWVRTHKEPLNRSIYNTYGYYFGQIRIAPDNADTVYILGVPLMKSTDGGKTFIDISTQGGTYGVNGVHADMQALWIDPSAPKRLLLGNDGGLNISYDEGSTWQKIDNLSLAQCYTVNYDFQKPYFVYTGLQDNGVNAGPGNFKYGDRKRVWQMIMGGDGAFVQPDPVEPHIVYAAFQFGSISRLNLKESGKSKGIKPPSKRGNRYRYNWLTPFKISKHNRYTLYLGANKVLKSVNRGDQWMEISPDLTDRKNINGDVPFATIVSIDESPISPEILYAGTDDGNVWVSMNAGQKWQQINQGLPKKWVTRMEASRFKKGRVYVTLTGYREDDFSTYVFSSQDYGKTWTSIKANLPDESLNVIREDPVNENILYLGSELSIYCSINRGLSWYSLRNNLPTNAVYDIKIHPRDHDLIIGTHGRGIYILPLKMLHKTASEYGQKTLVVLKVDEVRQRSRPWQRQVAARMYFICKKGGKVTISIKDKSGKVLLRLTEQTEPGINTFNLKTKIVRQGKFILKKGNYTIVISQGKIKASHSLLVK